MFISWLKNYDLIIAAVPYFLLIEKKHHYLVRVKLILTNNQI